MKTTKINKKGFSILEIVLVMAIICVLLGLTVNYYSGTQIRADIDTQAANIVHYLRLAQSSAAAGLNNESHGIHFQPESYTIFHGDTYDPNSMDNFQVMFPETMTINSLSLNGGGTDLIFSKTTGETAQFGTIMLNSNQINKTVTITVSPVGTVNY